MAQALQYGSDVIAQVQKLYEALEALRDLRQRILDDSTLSASYISASGHRTDLVQADIDAVIGSAGAVQALLVPYDSGSPTNRSLFEKLL
jgi:hypothetical protein